ncbi:MAG: trimeric autotransporter adhesin [Patescibacteria group bacterium]|jgi:hypothetical protein|nr:trimeric autotransporter adhesin [Patescibacteria group bacterium]
MLISFLKKSAKSVYAAKWSATLINLTKETKKRLPTYVAAIVFFIKKLSKISVSLFWRVVVDCQKRFKELRKIIRSRRLNYAGKFVYGSLVTFGTKGVAGILIGTLLLSSFALFDGSDAMAATYTFSQSSWAGGTSASTLVHPTNQSGWTAYSSTSGLTPSTTLALATSSTNIVQTSDANANTGFNLTGYSHSQTQVSGTGDSASIKLSTTGSPAWSSVLTFATSTSSWNSTGQGIATFASDFVRMVWHNNTANDLVYNMCANDACTSTTTTFLDTANNVGYDPAIAKSTVDGFARIVYHYGTTPGLKFIKCTNASCSTKTTTTIDSSSAINRNMSIALDASDNAYVSYYDETNANLKYIQCTNATCSTRNTTVIDSTGNVGKYTSIALGADGFARISYYDVTNSDVKFVRCTDAACSTNVITVVDATASGYTSLAMASDGFARISYSGASGYLYFAQCTNSDCSTKNTTVVESANCADNTSLELGTDGLARISYTSGGTTIKFAQCTNASCSTKTTSTVGTGAGSSLTLTSTDLARVIYRKSDFSAGYYQYQYLGYNSSGTYESGPIDSGMNPLSWGTLSWTNSGGQTVTMKARSSATSDFSGATDWGSCTNITSGAALSTGGCVTNGHRYVQYQASLSTSDTLVTPSIDDVTVTYIAYGTSGTITGNAYDSTDATNLIGGLSWTEDASLPSGTTATVSLRTAASSGALAAAVYTDLTNASGDCSKVGGVVTCAAAALPSGMTSSGTNRYFQYKVTLGSGGDATPTVSNVTVTYVVNASPEFNPDYPDVGDGGVSAVQNADGTVGIAYSVRDPDTTTGTYTPGLVAPSFEYSLDGGSSWSTVATSSLDVADYATKAVDVSSYTAYTATWDVTEQFTDQYDIDAKIRVIIDDAEPANNTASSTSAAFTLDTTAPVAGTPPILLDASQATPLVTLDATDEGAVFMKIGVMPDLSDADYEDFAANRSLELSSGDVVYAQFKDAVNNETEIYSLTPISAPSNTFFQDTSNGSISEWREFFAWGVADEPEHGFSSYNVYRSVDGGAFALLTTISNRLVNYIVDSGLDESATYKYKVSIEDDLGNISFFSPSTATDQPDGVGGSDLTAPTLSGVTVSNVTTTGATITWTTNKLSDSTVFYAATSTYPGSDQVAYDDSTGVPSMVELHSVVLSGLTPSTDYYFLTESTDSSDNGRQLASPTYTFTTSDGPIISNVTTAEVFDNETTISWNTNVPADSTVYYSENSDMSDPEVSSSVALTEDHAVTISGLAEGTRYYYYVKSVDAESNEAFDQNVVSGTVQYYSLNTSSDGSAPVISGTDTALIGETGVTITWTTSEPSTSQIEWGDTNALGTFTEETSVYTRQHAVVLTGLTTESEYYYRVLSRDKSGNEISDDDGGSPYSFTTLSPTTVTVNANNSGGGRPRDNRDLTKPQISNISVNSIDGTSAVVSYQTSKIANEKIEYGLTETYDKTSSNPDVYKTSHMVYLTNLSAGLVYHYKITAADIYANTGYTTDLTFTAGESSTVADTTDPTTEAPPDSLEAILLAASEDQLASVFSSLSSKAAQSPLIFGVDVTARTAADSATIEWVTDKPSNSLVAYSESSDYKKGEPYTITVGFPDERTTEHQVILDNLDPSSTYHFQAISEGYLGAVAVSNDGVFETTSLIPDIMDTRMTDVGEDFATIEWKTALPSKSFIEIKNTSTGDVLEVEDPSYVKDHTYTVEDLNDSTTYNVKLRAVDVDGNASSPVTIPVSTALSPGKPVISDLKISTSIIPDRVETTQTIISWKTNKPATSQVFFSQGSKTTFDESTKLDTALVRDHVVITTALTPGLVYTMSAESGSTGGDVARSEPFTILTPQPRASVVDLIFENFDTTFGFLNGKK